MAINYIFKLVIAGDINTGKTSYIHMFGNIYFRNCFPDGPYVVLVFLEASFTLLRFCSIYCKIDIRSIRKGCSVERGVKLDLFVFVEP